MARLDKKNVLIIATDGFEKSELFYPRTELFDEGAQVSVASIKGGEIRSMEDDEWSEPIRVDMTLDQVDPDRFDALVIPGGVVNPDKLRQQPKAVEIVRSFMSSGKPVAAICHGPWMLAEADVVRGRTVTSYPSIRTDLRNAGANVVDQTVAADGNLITSRRPDDLSAFTEALIDMIGRRQDARGARVA